MRNAFIKKIAVFAAVMTILLSFAGCAGSKNENGDSAATSSVNVSSSQTQASEPPMNMKIYRPGLNLANAQNLVDKIGELTNTRPVFLESGWDNWTDKVALMITTGDDVQWINIELAQPYNEWGKNGMLHDLRPIIEANKDELKVLYSIINSETIKPYLGPNGEVYALPAINFAQNQGLAVRQDWLDKLGLPKPDSLDDIYEMLKKFGNEKPAGNGTIPFVSDRLGAFNWIFYAYGGMTFTGKSDSPKYYKEGAEYKPYDISDMNREALKYVRKLMQEGLVNADWPTLEGQNKCQDTYISGLAGLVYFGAAIRESLYKTNPAYKSEGLPAPKGPTGIQDYSGTSPVWMANTIPIGCKDPLRVLKLIEFMHSREGRMLCVNGIEGVHYELTADGKIDANKYLENRQRDFADVNGGNPPIEWGIVSGMKGYLDVEKYPDFEDALLNFVNFQYVPKQPVDEDYSGWVAAITKYAHPYKYSGYTIDANKSVTPTVVEYVSSFYIDAIISKNFDIDAEWPGFVEGYWKNNGRKALDIFTEYMKDKE